MRRRIRAFGFRSFKNRLLILIAGLIGLVQSATLVLALGYVHRDVLHTADQQLLASQTVLQRQLELRELRMTATAEVLISDFGFKEAVASNDGATIRSALANQINRIDATLAVLYAPDGQPLAATDPDNFSIQAMTRLLRPSITDDTAERSQSFYAVVDGRPMQVVLTPLRAPEPIAWVAFGFALDTVQERGFDALIHADVKFVAAPAAAQPVSTGAPEPVQLVQQAGQYFLALALPLTARGGALTLLIRRPLTEVMEPYRNVRDVLLTIAGLALAGAIGIALVAGQSAARPVELLSGAVRRIEAGRYDQPVKVRGATEFVKLARSFNAMQLGLRDREERIRYQGTHDALTGLVNREGMRLRLVELLEQSAPVTFLLFDVHRFRDINASLGREAADSVLRGVATRLAHATPPPDRVGRLSADQFGVIIAGGDMQLARRMAAEIAQDLRNGLPVGDARIALLTRVGISTTDSGCSADDLLRRADVALLEAKEQGIDAVCYEAGHDIQHRRSVSLVAELRRAIVHDGLTLAYQPVVRVADAAMGHFEALLRWSHPTLGEISPAEFIPLAERASAIADLTQWVMGAVIDQLRRWQLAGRHIRVAVNLSASDVADASLPASIFRRLAEARVGAAQLLFEVTESAIMRDPRAAIGVIEQLRAAGCRFAIDDFGTGHSSLAQVHSLPIDELKIDRSFVREVGQSARSLMIVRTVIDLARGLHLETVAEGVETPETLALLARLGCDCAQGYIISRPLAADAVLGWLDARQRELATATESARDTGDIVDLRAVKTRRS